MRRSGVPSRVGREQERAKASPYTLDVAAFALDVFEQQAEAYCRARAWREWQYQSGQRPGRGLVTLYDEDFPDFTSADLFADLQGADAEDPKRQRGLTTLLASASLEGRTREFASKVAGFPVRTTVQ